MYETFEKFDLTVMRTNPSCATGEAVVTVEPPFSNVSVGTSAGGVVWVPKKAAEIELSLNSNVTSKPTVTPTTITNTPLIHQYFCSREKTGQRLLNHFAAGVSSIVFRETGPMDVAGQEYPLAVESVGEAGEKLETVLESLDSDNNIREKLREYSLERAGVYDLGNLSWRMLLAIVDMAEKTGKIRF